VTDQQELDALSERVARKMGWQPVPEFPSFWTEPNRAGYRDSADFATEWELVPEMLAWLRERGQVTIHIPMTESIGVQVSFDDVDTIDIDAESPTLPEAVARLVVAVAEREAKEQP